MDHSRLRDNNVLIEFLNQNGIPAVPSINANPGMLHWWEFEKIERITDAAIFEGYFFLAVTEQGFSLHVFNGESDWYNYVRVWKADIPETQFLQDLKSIIFADNIYSFDSYVWFCVRETYFDFEWRRTTSDIQNIKQISPELRSGIFKFEESLVETPQVRELQQSIKNLIRLLTQDDVRNPVNCLIMQRYFPPPKYENSRLPAEVKSLLREIGESFDGGNFPTKKALDNLIQKAEDLHDLHNTIA
jgi:hypothetical protein